jgi:hypothetical protein
MYTELLYIDESMMIDGLALALCIEWTSFLAIALNGHSNLVQSDFPAHSALDTKTPLRRWLVF